MAQTLAKETRHRYGQFLNFYTCRYYCAALQCHHTYHHTYFRLRGTFE